MVVVEQRDFSACQLEAPVVKGKVHNIVSLLRAYVALNSSQSQDIQIAVQHPSVSANYESSSESDYMVYIQG